MESGVVVATLKRCILLRCKATPPIIPHSVFRIPNCLQDEVLLYDFRRLTSILLPEISKTSFAGNLRDFQNNIRL